MKIAEINGKSARKTYKVLLANQSIPCDITIFDEKESHKLQISEGDVRKFAKLIELSSEDYIKTLLQILTGEIKTSFVSISNDEVSFNKTKNIRFFFKQAQSVNHAETMQNVTDHLYQQNCSQNTEIDKLKAENDNLTGELQKLHEKVENIIDNANQHENQLCACLIQVLNEKKKYIQLLKYHIDEKDLKAVENVTEKRKAVISESDSEEYDTDEERNVKKLQTLAGPSTSSTNPEMSTSCRTAVEKEMDIDSNVFDSDADTNDNEIFCTALPPRTTQVADVDFSEAFTEKEPQINEGMSQELEVETFMKEKSPKKQEKEEFLQKDTPVITFSTQDMLDAI